MQARMDLGHTTACTYACVNLTGTNCWELIAHRAEPKRCSLLLNSRPVELDRCTQRGECRNGLRPAPLRGARDLAGQRKSYVFQRFVGVPPRGVDVAVSQGALHVGYRHAGA